MKHIKIFLFVFALLGVFTSYAQDEVPTEILGKWKVVNAYAADANNVLDSLESAALLDDLVNVNVVEYAFTSTSFSLFVNGDLTGTCNFSFIDETSEFIFDEGGNAFNDIVKNIVGVNLTETEFYLLASPPDGDSQLIFHEFLVKQP
jgi:hypothetical protein